MSLVIRDFDPSRDEVAARAFIDGSQRYEAAFEPNRRLDGQVAVEQYTFLTGRVAHHGGRIFLAEEDGRAIGWAVMSVEEHPVFVVEAERRYAYIAELFVDEAKRGLGVGRALIAACEDEARRAGLRQIKIGVLTANRRAAEIYRRTGYGPYSMELRKYL
jgi:GNAT superfamily N-acetyltransferase